VRRRHDVLARVVVFGAFAALPGCSPGEDASAAPSCQAAPQPLGTEPALGHAFPDVPLTDCEGNRGTLREVRCENDLTIVSIGAGWCAPCLEETPDLQAAHEELRDEGIGVVQIVFQDGQAAPATTAYCKKWVETFALTLPVFVDPPGNTLAHFDSAVTPLNLMLDRDGRVLWSKLGKVPDDLIGVARALNPR
jgi:cytochrome c biogenesis protein CcmG/thiol:disulfide interchange protein DsbE